MQNNSPVSKGDARYERIAALIKAGKSNRQIGMECHVTLGVVAGIRTRLKHPPYCWPKDDERVLRKLVKWNWPLKSIAQALGLSTQAIVSKMHREGMKFAKASKPRSFA